MTSSHTSSYHAYLVLVGNTIIVNKSTKLFYKLFFLNYTLQDAVACI